MEKAQKKRRNPFLVLLVVLLCLMIILPAACVGFSFIGRISPDSVIPDSYAAYLHIPDPVQCAKKILAHEPLNEILADPSFARAASALSALRESGLLENTLVNLLGNGTLDGALFKDGSFLACYDTGMVSPFLRVLPALSARLTIPHLYYVSAGRNSRFEYRPDGGKILYIAPFRNLLILSDSSDLLESALSGKSRTGDAIGSTQKEFRSRDFDAGILLASDTILSAIGSSDPALVAALSNVDFAGQAELAVSITERKLALSLVLPVETAAPDLKPFFAHNSTVPALSRILPESTQYSTLFSAGSLADLVSALVALSGSDTADLIAKADSSSRSLLGFGLDELVYSWAGSEIAAFGLEGRPRPIFAIQVKDEAKRKAIFDSVFSTVVVNEDVSVVLDGLRIPQIRLPEFLERVLRIWKITVPSPYYVVEDGYLFLSESPENLLATVNAIRKNKFLMKSEIWKALSAQSFDQSDRSSVSLFYSLDRAVPFFLKGSSGFHRILQLYRQGLVQLSLDDRLLTVTLSALAGSASGLISVPGYPVDLNGKVGNQVQGLLFDKKGESRLLAIINDTTVIAYDPVDEQRYSMENADPVWCVPAEGLRAKTAEDPSVWVVSSRGQVTLVNGNLQPAPGFPVSAGSRMSAAPATHDGKLYLSDADASMYVVDGAGTVTPLSLPFTDILRSPPSFSSAGSAASMAFYPKTFAGQLWLCDAAGLALPGWPVPVSGISFGSPLLFSAPGSRLAFITQAGELSVYDEKGAVIPGFPVTLSGLFYAQPIFDGDLLWAVSAEGYLYQVSLTGVVLSQKIADFSAESGTLTACDIDHDRVPEIFVSGDGNALYGFSRNFTALAGFPLPLWGKPFLGDMNGDGSIDCTGAALDNRLYSWQFR